MTTDTDRNEEIIKRFYKVWDSGETTDFNEILSKNLIDHEQEMRTDTSGFEGMFGSAKSINAIFSNSKHNLLQTYFLEDNKAIVYWEFTGRHTGSISNAPPTGQQVRFKGVDIFQIENGKISEIWHVEALHKMYAVIRGN